MTHDAAVPAALAGLSNLQRCYMHLYAGDDGLAPPLPAGPWLASLRWLRYNVDGLISSTATLRAATALEFLDAGNSDSSTAIDWRSAAAAAFFYWLEDHPPLRLVYFDTAGGQLFDSGDFAAHVMWLCRRRPSMGLVGCSNLHGGGFGRHVRPDVAQAMLCNNRAADCALCLRAHTVACFALCSLFCSPCFALPARPHSNGSQATCSAPHTFCMPTVKQ